MTRRWLLLAPVLAFVLGRGVLVVAAAITETNPWLAKSWSRGDSGHYVAIALRGYTLGPCGEGRPYKPDDWCGNAGWMPGFPWLIRGLSRLGLSGNASGALIATTFHLATLIALWAGPLRAQWNARHALALSLAALFPGQVYYHAIFPISTFLALVFVFLWLAARGRVLLAGLTGGVAALVYSTGFLLAPLAAVAALLQREQPLTRRLWRALAASSLVVAGLATVMLVHHLSVGAWDAFFKVQAKYGHGIHNPLATLSTAVKPAFERANWRVIGGRLVAFRASGGKFVCAEGGGGHAVMANRAKVGDWETFEEVSVGDGSIALRTTRGLFLCAEGGGGEAMVANRTKIGPWETFALEMLAEGRVALKTHGGFYVGVGEGDRLEATSREPVAAAKFERRNMSSRGLIRLTIPLQIMLSVLLVLGTSAHVLMLPRSRSDVLVALYAAAFLLFPLLMGPNVHLYRAVSLLLPVVLLLPRMPRWLVGFANAVALLVALLVGVAFFSGLLT